MDMDCVLCSLCFLFLFLFKQKTAYEMRISDWSSDVCSSDLPMATVLFPAGMVGLAVLPLMLFHQMQLMVCAAMAWRYAKRPEEYTGRRPGNDAGKPIGSASCG